MPLFYSISEGISLGVISYVLLNVAAGKARQEVAPLMYVLAVLLFVPEVYLPQFRNRKDRRLPKLASAAFLYGMKTMVNIGGNKRKQRGLQLNGVDT